MQLRCVARDDPCSELAFLFLLLSLVPTRPEPDTASASLDCAVSATAWCVGACQCRRRWHRETIVVVASVEAALSSDPACLPAGKSTALRAALA